MNCQESGTNWRADQSPDETQFHRDMNALWNGVFGPYQKGDASISRGIDNIDDSKVYVTPQRISPSEEEAARKKAEEAAAVALAEKAAAEKRAKEMEEELARVKEAVEEESRLRRAREYVRSGASPGSPSAHRTC